MSLFYMAQGLEEVNRNIKKQFKLLERAWKEAERLIRMNKRSKIENYLQHIELELKRI